MEETKQNTKLWIMAIALGLLIIISGVQAIELVSLKNKINTEIGDIKISSSSTSTSSSSGSLQQNIQNLPTMVGGC